MWATIKLSRRFPALGSFVSKAIDPALNLAIFLVCVFLVVVAFIRAEYPQTAASPTSQAQRGKEHIGRWVFLEGMDWSKSDQTLVMFLSTTCSYCKKSEVFYRQLTSEPIDHKKVRLIAVFPQPSKDGKEYLDRTGIRVDDVRQRVANDLKVKGTPTLVLVNRDGIAMNEWEGLLTATQEAEVMTHLGLTYHLNK
jgi:thioredoxin-related protein